MIFALEMRCGPWPGTNLCRGCLLVSGCTQSSTAPQTIASGGGISSRWALASQTRRSSGAGTLYWTADTIAFGELEHSGVAVHDYRGDWACAKAVSETYVAVPKDVRRHRAYPSSPANRDF